jgi:hypothetical protein
MVIPVKDTTGGVEGIFAENKLSIIVPFIIIDIIYTIVLKNAGFAFDFKIYIMIVQNGWFV